MEEMRNVQETAAYLGMGVSTVRALVRRGEIGYVRWRSRIMFRQSDLDAYFESRCVPPVVPAEAPREAIVAVPDVAQVG